MPRFAYRAIAADGAIERGLVAATDEDDLYRQLRALDKELLSAQVKRESPILQMAVSGVKTRDLVQLCSHLETLEAAGVPLLDGLADIRDSTASLKLREIMSAVHRDVGSGVALSDAFRRHPDIFDEIFCGLIAAGEETGDIGRAVAEAGRMLRWRDETNSRIKKVTRYPIAMLVVMTGVLAFLLTFVVPKVVGFLTFTGIELPAATRALIGLSEGVQAYGLYILAAIIACVVFVMVGRKSSPVIAYQFDAMMLKLPVIGEVNTKLALSRFSNTLAMCYMAGIDLLACLATAERAVGNRAIQRSVAQVRRDVTDGRSIWQSMDATGTFPPIIVRAVKIGEDTGRLEGVLRQTAEFFDRDVAEAVEGMTAAIQPIMTGIMGLMLCWIILAVFGPIYGSLSQIR